MKKQWYDYLWILQCDADFHRFFGGGVTMVLFKPRSWCVYCPMGTMTQLICKVKNQEV